MIYGKLTDGTIKPSFEIINGHANTTIELSIGWTSDPMLAMLELDGYMEVIYPEIGTGKETYEIVNNQIIVSYVEEEA